MTGAHENVTDKDSTVVELLYPVDGCQRGNCSGGDLLFYKRKRGNSSTLVAIHDSVNEEDGGG